MLSSLREKIEKDKKFVKLPWSETTVAVSAFLAPYDYNSQTLDDDLNLLRLEEPIDLDATEACLLCIPEDESTTDLDLDVYTMSGKMISNSCS
jgi:hypothetical protein